MSDQDAHRGQAVSYWLRKLRKTETAEPTWKEAVAALVSIGEPAIPALIEAAGDESRSVRTGASTALRKMGPAKLPFLIKALKHENRKVREAAAQGLYGLGPEAAEAIPDLTEALQDTDAFVRQWAATALERIAHSLGPAVSIAVPGLIDLLREGDYMVREWAAHALGSIGSSAEAAIPSLTEALLDDVPSVRDAASDALDKIQGPTDNSEKSSSP